MTSRTAQSQDVRIHYWATGEGPLVILLHGFPDYSETWRFLVPQIADAYRVVAMDSRGYNLSDQPPNSEDYALEILLQDILAVAETEGERRFTLIGHDMGGAIAWQFAMTYPDRLTGLAVLSMPHPASYEHDLQTNRQQRQARELFSDLLNPEIADSLTPGLLASWVSDPDLQDSYLAAFQRSSITGMLHYFRNIDFSSSGAKTIDELTVNLPLLLIHGEDDSAILVSGHDATFDYVSVDSAMLRVPDASHMVHHDAPELVNSTIRSWLDLHRD